LNGWTLVQELSPPYRGPDPLSIDFVTFRIECDEDEPGVSWGATDPSLPPILRTKKFVTRIPITNALATGDFYLKINDPEIYFERGSALFPVNSTGETVFYNPKPSCLIADTVGNSVESVLIDGMRGDYYPGNDNLRLTNPLLYAYTTNRYLYIIGGWSISLSQIRFERNVRLEDSVEATIDAQLLNPRRYRLVTKKELEYLSEAENLAGGALDELGQAQQSVTAILDGDPRVKIGYRMVPLLDPGREEVFHNVNMLIDDVQYTVEDVDFVMQLTLGTIDHSNPAKGSRAVSESYAAIQGAQQSALQKSVGVNPLTRTIK